MAGADASGAVDWHHQIAESFRDGYQRSPGFKERFAVWSALLAQHVQPGDQVLDAGCGSGIFSFEAAKRAGRVRALDGAAAMIELCEAEKARCGATNVSFETGYLDVLRTWEPSQFDVILSSSVLEYVDDFEATLASMARLLKPGGRMIISMPNGDGLYRKAEAMIYKMTGKPRYYAHVRNVVTAARMQGLLKNHGLQVQTTQYYAEPPLPMGLAALLGGERSRKTLFVQVATA
jgi:2-polyprenyl-3-methyl-5-hydroxy-6-metoxy-1,4-benzoquinol methylase